MIAEERVTVEAPDIPKERTWREMLDYLVQVTGKDEPEIVAQALVAGAEILYRRELQEAYLSGTITRERAVEELGRVVVADLDYAREAIREDVRWGLGLE